MPILKFALFLVCLVSAFVGMLYHRNLVRRAASKMAAEDLAEASFDYNCFSIMALIIQGMMVCYGAGGETGFLSLLFVLIHLLILSMLIGIPYSTGRGAREHGTITAKGS